MVEKDIKVGSDKFEHAISVFSYECLLKMTFLLRAATLHLAVSLLHKVESVHN